MIIAETTPKLIYKTVGDLKKGEMFIDPAVRDSPVYMRTTPSGADVKTVHVVIVATYKDDSCFFTGTLSSFCNGTEVWQVEPATHVIFRRV